MTTQSFAEISPDHKIIKNQLLTAVFNDRGLVELRDHSLAKPFTFTRDDFTITIDGEKIESAGLEAKEIAADSESIRFLFSTDEFKIEAEYELRPDWHFISKQIFITPQVERDFYVERLDVLNGELTEDIAGEYIPRTRRPQMQTGDYGAFLRFADATGMMMLVQNPFLEYRREDKGYSFPYRPDMAWNAGYGPFASDRACIGTYMLSGRRVPAALIPEWKWTAGIIPITDEEQDWAEVRAFTECVSAFVMQQPEKSLRINIAWCQNDYQIDIATADGREEYKRIIDRAAEMGLDYILFAPTNSDLGTREETADDWNWENLLWLGLGIKIRNGEWDPAADPLPPSVQEMLDYAKSKNIKLVAYMYPVMPFAGNPEWIIEGAPYHRKKRNASMGFRSFQDFLIEKLSVFMKRTGIGGYAYDYTFLWYDKPSRYAQWWGWKRIKDSLRQEFPDIVIDGRQLDMLYGPWIWVSGSYPHPTAADEQPESFNPFPDLHFDRVSANRQRFTAYRYRVQDYCPPELMPGFIGHQTPRREGDTIIRPDNTQDASNVQLRLDTFRERDWDYLGWKYSLFSSIAVSGLNHAVSMIPARDPAEYRHFSEKDISFFRHWLDWTDENLDYLLNTRFIIGQPAIGRIDGTSAIVNDRGYIFLFNPNSRKMNAEFSLDDTIGLQEGERFLLQELHPAAGRLIGKPHEGIWQYGDTVSIPMDGASERVLALIPAPEFLREPLLFNAAGTVTLSGTALSINDCRGEIGTDMKINALLPGDRKVEKVILNGNPVNFSKYGQIISVAGKFAGDYFGHQQQIDEYRPDFRGGNIDASFTIPARIFQQLERRKKSWPIPWTEDDYKTTWLAPERLLLFIQIAEVREEMEIDLTIDANPLNLIKAYTSVRVHPRCFVGFYADVSHLQPDRKYRVELRLPQMRPGQYQGMFFENVETEYTEKFDNY